MSVAKLKKRLKDELEDLEYTVLIQGCESFDHYKFVIGQHYAIRNTLQTIKDIADEASRGSNVSTED